MAGRRHQCKAKESTCVVFEKKEPSTFEMAMFQDVDILAMTLIPVEDSSLNGPSKMWIMIDSGTSVHITNLNDSSVLHNVKKQL